MPSARNSSLQFRSKVPAALTFSLSDHRSITYSIACQSHKFVVKIVKKSYVMIRSLAKKFSIFSFEKLNTDSILKCNIFPFLFFRTNWFLYPQPSTNLFLSRTRPSCFWRQIGRVRYSGLGGALHPAVSCSHIFSPTYFSTSSVPSLFTSWAKIPLLALYITTSWTFTGNWVSGYQWPRTHTKILPIFVTRDATGMPPVLALYTLKLVKPHL